MRVFGESLSVPAAPFLHLAYLEAKAVRPEKSFLLSAGLAAVLGALLVARGFGSLRRPMARPRVVLGGGLVLLLAGGLLALSWRMGTEEYEMPVRLTEVRLQTCVGLIGEHLAGGGSLPYGPADFTALKWDVRLRVDAWGRDFRIGPFTGGPSGPSEIRSAGPNGFFDDDDDLLEKIPVGEPGPSSSVRP